MRLSSYLFTLVAGRILATLAVLVSILQILDLLDATTDILDRQLGAGGVVYYALLRLPRLIEQAAPISVLTGALFAFMKLARESAVTALRSTGVSAYRIAVMALPAAALMAALQLAIGLLVAPRTDAMLSDWWRANTPPAEAKPAGPLTFRVGAEIVTGRPSADGRSLSGVTIYRRTAGGELAQRIQAPSAVYADGRWTLQRPRFETLGSGGVATSTATEMAWAGQLQPQDVVTLAAGPTEVTAQAARRALEGGPSLRPRSYYDTQIQRAWAAPVACLVMLLLAAPAALAHFRGGQGGTLLVVCLAAGLMFLVFDGAVTALGESGAAPPILAAWAAPLIFGALGLTALLWLEG